MRNSGETRRLLEKPTDNAQANLKASPAPQSSLNG